MKKFSVLEQIVLVYRTLFRMSGGSLFHWFGPDTEKPRRPNLSVLARGTTRSPWSVERSRGRCAAALTELQISCKYIGADPLTQLRTSVQILNVMRWRTGNPCSVSRMAVVIRPNLGMFSISRAEEFCIDCRRRTTYVLQPNRVAIVNSGRDKCVVYGCLLHAVYAQFGDCENACPHPPPATDFHCATIHLSTAASATATAATCALQHDYCLSEVS